MTRLDVAVYKSAWQTSAFGVPAEIKRILRWWDRAGVPFENVALIRAYYREPHKAPKLTSIDG